MKFPFLRSLVFFLLIMFSSCNFFDLIDPDMNHSDRCKQLADKKKYDEAIESCLKADPSGTNPEIQVELGDIYLAKVGVDLKVLSSVFLDKTGSNALIINLANKLLEQGAITLQKKENALKAVTAFDSANNSFYSMLARLCYVSVLIAYTDSDGRGSVENDGFITQPDICSASSCENICVEDINDSVCDGMSSVDALVAAQNLTSISSLLAELGLGSVTNNLNNMLNIEVPDPNHPSTNIKISELTGADQGDAVRKLFWIMAE